MAKRVKDQHPEVLGAKGTAAEVDAGERKRIIAECVGGWRDIVKERQALNEQAGEIRERLRNAKIDPKAVLHAVRLAEMEDQAARAGYVDDLHLTFEALGLGEQLDWIKAHERRQDEAGDAADVRPRFLRGKRADVGEPAGTA